VSAEDGSSGFRCGCGFLRVAIGIVSRDVVSMPIVAVWMIPAGVAAIAWFVLGWPCRWRMIAIVSLRFPYNLAGIEMETTKLLIVDLPDSPI